MLDVIFATVAGAVKDITVVIGKTYDVVAEELSAIPDAVSHGYQSGLFTGKEEDLPLDHHIDIPEHSKPKFGQASCTL